MIQEYHDYLFNLADSKILKESTCKKYYKNICNYYEYTCSDKVLTKKNIDKYIYKKYENNLSKNTYNSIIYAFRNYIYFLSVIDTNLNLEDYNFLKSKFVRHAKYKKISENDIEKICDEINPGLMGLRLEALLRLCYETGLKTNEIVNLKISDFNYEKREIIVHTDENWRILPLTIKTQNVLIQYIGNKKAFYDSDSIFTNHHNKKISGRGLLLVLEDICKIINYNKQLTPDCFRYNYSRRLWDDNYAIREIQQLLGHKNYMSTYQLLFY